ncbi:hypothetical protein KDL44_03095 [bacterium]|nr:hypothetical protein [bacterium]
MGHAYIRPVAAGFVITLALLCGLLQLQAVAAPEESPPDSRWFSQRTEDSGYVRTIVNAIQPLDAPGNPYAGMYSGWDHWAMQNFQSGFTISDIGAEFKYPYDPEPDEDGMVRQWMDMRVDRDGFLVPWTHFLASWTNKGLTYGSGEGQPGSELAVGFAVGMIDHTAYANWKMAIEEARSGNQAQTFPPIPAWLMQQDPLSVVFVPNGDICVKGPFGIVEAGMDHQAVMDLKAHERWYRYSPQGELLETGQIYPWSIAEHAWMCFYWPELPGKVAEMKEQGYVPHYSTASVRFEPDRSRTMQHEAEHMFSKPEFKPVSPEEVIAFYDYTGSQIAADTVEDKPRMIRQLDWPAIGNYFEAQKSRGVTGDSMLSPFEGQPNGPVRLQGSYRAPVAVIPPNQDARSPYPLLEVRPLDDPANPYAGQYSEWDRLCYANASLRNEELTALFDAKRRAMETSVAEAKAAGKDLDQYMQENPGISTAVSHNEMLDQRIVSLYNAVDAEGWLVPATGQQPVSRGDESATYIRANVTLTEDQFARYQEWTATNQ